MPKAHARNSPSGSPMWLRCPGSLNFIEDGELDDGSGIAADEGTILHSFCEDCVRDNVDPYRFIGEEREHNGYKYTLTEADADHIQEGLDYIDDIPGKLVAEHQVDLSRWMPDQFGTLDVGIAGKKRITIFDWKWGYDPVNPVEHEPTMIYALGFWDNIARHITDAEDFRIVIWQPRNPRGGGEWDVTLDELLKFGKKVKRKAARTKDPDAPRIPGAKQCQYCPGAKTLTCQEYSDWHMEMICADFDEMDELAESGLPIRLPPRLTPERRSFILENKASIEKWMSRLYVDALDDAQMGRAVPGLKAADGRKPAEKWEDKEAAEAFLVRALGDDAYRKTLISPKQARDELPPKLTPNIDRLASRAEPKPVLVPEHDSRPALRSIVDEFEDLD